MTCVVQPFSSRGCELGTKSCEARHGRHGRSWSMLVFQVYQTVHYICIEFDHQPDEETLLKLKRSMFMYGFLHDRACYHAVYSDENWALAQDLIGERRAMDRIVCGQGGCSLPKSHQLPHRGACGCLNGCKAWECPNL